MAGPANRPWPPQMTPSFGMVGIFWVRGLKIRELSFLDSNSRGATTDRFIGKLGGYVRSEKTGNTYPILLRHMDKLIPPDGYGIPARHQFHIGADFFETGGLPAQKFLEQFGILTFVFEYDGETFTRLYTFEEISKEVAKAREDLTPKPVKSEAGFQKMDRKP
jgi:hypothetical protein